MASSVAAFLKRNLTLSDLSRRFGKRCLASASVATSRAVNAAAPDGSGMVCWFGRKHYGRPLSQLLAEDPAYCRWILSEAQDFNASHGLQQTAAWLRANAPHLDPKEDQSHAQRIAGHKHCGLDLSELVLRDPTYCQWILREAKEKNSTEKMQKLAAWLTENAPQVQEEGLRAGGTKHYGRPISELVTEDPLFCQWILRRAEEEDASHGIRGLASWLKENAPQLQEKGAFASGAKHKGRPMSEVVAEDPGYCQWVLQQAEEGTASNNLRAMAAWLTANAPQLKEQTCMASGGKHQGRPMSEVAAQDPAYCQWILRTAKDDSASLSLRIRAHWLKENMPQLQEQKSASSEGRRFLSQLVAEDPSYCQWILQAAEEEHASDKQRSQASWLLKHAPHLKETPVVLMRSVHKGIPLPQVVAEDPGWCRFVLDQEAKSKAFASAAEWLRENVPELLKVSKDDAAAVQQMSERMLAQYGQWFVVRCGKHRMKTFAAILEDHAPFVRWIEQVVEGGDAYKNYQLLAAYALQQRGQDSSN